MKVKAYLAATMSLVVILMGCTTSPTTPGPTPTPKAKAFATPPPLTINPEKRYIATIETEKGNLVLELFAREAPRTVNNFAFLAQEGFYDNNSFHRVIPGFMAQGGAPKEGWHIGYIFEDEFSQHSHVAGALSMANAGPNTNSSQFFICYTPQPHLDGHHTVFGQLVEGMDVLKKIIPRDPAQRPAFSGDTIIRITIEETSG